MVRLAILRWTVALGLILQVRAAWQDEVQPKKRIPPLALEKVERFKGNQTHSDYFKLLEQDGEHLLVGARNVVYNISLSHLDLKKKIEWFSSEKDISMCKLKGKSEEACQNYIRVLAKKKEDKILVCGTNAYKPKCRDYLLKTDGSYEFLEEKPGEGLCPYDPNHNSTAIFAEADLYVATVGQFSGADPLIYRKPLRTEQFNLKHLNAPNFVSSIHFEDFVYFFFREVAVEYINCGKTVYSRVARVCTKDKGGPHKFKDRWTSFLKARLNCSIGGDFPFYFNEIQSTSPIIEWTHEGGSVKLIYGVFTTPANSLSGSAVCAFKLDEIQKTFEGHFKGQEDINSNWLPVINSKVPEPRPGQCVNDSRTLPDVTLNFITNHPLMDQAVPFFGHQPILVHTGFQYRYTYIAIDPQVEDIHGKKYDVLFIGTDTGKVIKAVNTGNARDGAPSPVVVEEVTVFADRSPVTNLLVHHTQYHAKLVVVTHSEIQTIPLYNCEALAITCSECVSLQDPYCAWDKSQQRCTNVGSRLWNRKDFVQNIEDGWDPQCPKGPSEPKHGETSPYLNQKNTNSDPGSTVRQSPGHEGGVAGASKDQPHMYTAETLAIAVTTSIVSSLVVGFISGYIFSRRCRNDEVDSPYDDAPYLDGRDPSHMNHSESFLSPASNNKPINLVLNVPQKNSKNANSSADNKPVQKVKKIYL